MFSKDDVIVDILEGEGPLIHVAFLTPVGRGELLGSLRFVERTLYIDGLHIDGAIPGKLGRAGINMVLQKLMVEADVEKLVIQGEVRATGKNKGRRPRQVVFPR